MALYTTTPKHKVNSQLVCANLNYKCHGHTINVCYWLGEGKKGQFPPGFERRRGARGTAIDTKQGSFHQAPIANTAEVKDEDK